MPTVQPGIYTHYKGGRYRVLFTATHSETRVSMVVYLSMETGEIWTRPEAMWCESIVWPDGVTRSRFMRLNEEGSGRNLPASSGIGVQKGDD